MTRLWKALCLAGAVVALALFAISCSSGGTSYRVINAIANYDYQVTGGFDITMNGSLQFSGVQFTNINPPGKDAYQKVSSGSNTLAVFPKGDSVNGTPIIDSALSLNGRTQYTVMLMGNNTTNPYVAQPFTDNNAVPATGNFEFRVLDASNNLGGQQLDIYVVGNVGIVTGPNPPPPNATVTYGQASTYIAEPSGTWWLVVTTHGGHTPILNPTSYTPSALQIRTIVLVDGQNGFGVGTPLIFSDLN
ncbi:MAG TPA: DUF4397 domain-containing protein [Terriglobales bacterium]|nr:DUF4397 domain-containing protein [Terriglobales bacterium]